MTRKRQTADDRQQPGYSNRRAYLIRCWDESAGRCFQVETILAPGERRGFANLDALVDWLRHELDRPPLLPPD